MFAALSRCWWAAVLVSGLLAAPARADRGVRDGGNLFSAAARDKAEKQIEELWERTHKDFLIETVGELPADRAREYKALKKSQQPGMFRTYAAERARDASVDGVYVLLWKPLQRGDGPFARLKTVMKPPPGAQAVVVWPESNESLFPEHDQKKLAQIFEDIHQFDPDPEKFDRALAKATARVCDSLEANMRAQAAPPAGASFHWTVLLWAVGGVLGLWSVAGVLRRRAARRRGEEAPLLEPCGGALGGQFGATAGLWLFHRLVDRRRDEPLAEPEVPAPPPEAPAPETEPAASPDLS